MDIMVRCWNCYETTEKYPCDNCGWDPEAVREELAANQEATRDLRPSQVPGYDAKLGKMKGVVNAAMEKSKDNLSNSFNLCPHCNGILSVKDKQDLPIGKQPNDKG